MLAALKPSDIVHQLNINGEERRLLDNHSFVPSVSTHDAAVGFVATTSSSNALRRAIDDAKRAGLGYAGIVAPDEAWNLHQIGEAVIVDVRTAEERKFVGHVPDTLHVAWATGTSMTRNPRFTKDLEAKVGKDRVVLFLCRSGKRSALAAEAATKAGYRAAFNIDEGFEGDIDDRGQRGKLGGWRSHDLPWKQD